MASTVSDRPSPGRCPGCETTLQEYDVIIEYETDGGRAAWADCPECRDVVHPQG